MALKKYIWKMKVSLKIKVFMWFLHRKVVLTRDNHGKRNWEGNTSCYFMTKMNYSTCILYKWPLAKIVWSVVHMTFGLAPPKNIKNLFGNWVKGIPKKDLIQIRVGFCVVLWVL
jgi:hypothetical protein